MGAYSNFVNKIKAIGIRNQVVRESLAEFIGTFILITFGDGSVAQSVLSRGEKGEYLSINWGWGIAVVMGVHFASGVSGAHLNPAVTLAKASIGRFPWVKLPLYWAMQFIGAFAAAACLYGIYYDALNDFDGGERQVYGPNATASIWATYPEEYLTIEGGLGDQIFGTMLLLGCIMAIVDTRNNKPPHGMEPLLIGLAVFVIGLAFGHNCDYAINPARDLAPRTFSYWVGYGAEVWTPNGINWWWVPVVGPLIGGVCGALIYIVFVEAHHPDDKDSHSLDQNEFTLKDLTQEEGTDQATCTVSKSNAGFEEE
ncbi:aquaporin-9-like [Saccoglossus kowalevskii]